MQMRATSGLSFALVIAIVAADGEHGAFSCSRWEVSQIDVMGSESSKVHSFQFTYRDGTTVRYGEHGKHFNDVNFEPFVLEEGEVIVSVSAYNRLSWNCLAAIQFRTNRDRRSPVYGIGLSPYIAENQLQIIEGTEDDPIVALPAFGGSCAAIFNAVGSLLPSTGRRLSEVPGGATCLQRLSTLDDSPEQDGRYVEGRQFKICGVYRHTNRCLHVSSDPSDVVVQLDPQPWEEVKEWPGSLWEFHRPTPGGPWQIRSVKHPTHLLHVGGHYEDVRVWPAEYGNSDWTISAAGTEGGSTRWLFAPARNDHPGGYLHAGLWWWYTLVWGVDEGSYWYIENPKQ